MIENNFIQELIGLLNKTGDLAPNISEEEIIEMVDTEIKKMRENKKSQTS
jgi:hypothetical protein